MLSRLLGWLAGGGINAIGSQILKYQELKLKAATDKEKLEHEEEIQRLESQRDVLVKETQSKLTAWIRPALATPVVLYWWKLIVWDTLLGLGVTPYPGDHVVWFVITVPTAFFLVRPFERR